MRGIVLIVALALAGCEYQGQDAICDPSFAVLPVLAQGSAEVEIAVNCAEIASAVPGQEPHALDHTYVLMEGSGERLVVLLSFADMLDMLDNCGALEVAP